MSEGQNVLMEMLQEGTLCDIVLTAAGDVHFKAHRVILCGCSSYLRDLFCSKPEQRGLSFPDVEPNIMQLLVEFAYTRSAVVTEDNVQQLLAGAHCLGVVDLVQACCDHLQRRLCSHSCISTWRLAQQYQRSELVETAHQYILQHFQEVAAASEDFLQLSVEQLAGLLEDDELNVEQESSVFEAVLRWIHFSPEARSVHMAQLLSKVRLLLLPFEYLMDNGSKNHLVRNNLQCLKLLISSMKTIQTSNSEKPLTRTRLPPLYLLAVGGIEDKLPTDRIDLYNMRNNSWQTIHKSQKVFPEFCSVVYLGGNIYYIGGSDGDHYLSSVQRFNLATKTWREVGSMHVARGQASVAVLHGCIYAMGGCDQYDTHSSAERFDPDTNQWTWIAPMNMPRAGAGSATLHEKVYVCGGIMMNETLLNAEFYNLDTDQWTEITPMDSYWPSAGVVTYNNQIFVMGGYNGNTHTSDVSVYDPVSKTWHTVAPMLHCRSSFGVAVLEDQLYVVGGFHNNNKKPCSRVERYDGKNNKWHIVENMEAPRGALSCCVVDRISLTAANK